MELARLVMWLLVVVWLLTGCSLTERPNPVSSGGQQAASETYLSLPQELERSAQVRLELGGEAQELQEFADAMEKLRDQGLEFLSYGMPRQAVWCFGFVGGSVSAVHYAGELLLE